MSRSKIIVIVVTILVLISIPVAVILVMQRQEIRKKAAGQDLICQAVPNKNVEGISGLIRVTNNTSSAITMRTQQNRCAYKPYTGEPPNCNENPQQKLETVTANGSVDIPAWVPGNCEETQLDVWNNNVSGAKCWDPAGNHFWDQAMEVGANALAFVKVVNKGTYPNCAPSPSATPLPTSSPTSAPTATPTGTRTPTPTPSRTPTPRPGSTLTPTPRPTSTPTLIVIAPTAPPGSTPTPTTPPPVSGNLTPTILTILGGGVLLLVGLLL